MSELQEWVQETAQGDCAVLLERFVQALQDVDRDLQVDRGSFGARFRLGEATVCEVSVFGALFIVRVGDEGSVEYRVRDATVARQALDHILRHYVDVQARMPSKAVERALPTSNPHPSS